MRASLAIVAILLAVPALSAPTTEPPKQPEADAKPKPAVVSIIAYDAQGKQLAKGNGVIVKPNGVVATCWRLISRAARVRVSRGSEGSWTADGLIAWDSANDFALLKVPAPKAIPATPLGSSDSVGKGEKVTVDSRGDSADLISTDTTVAAICAEPRMPKFIELAGTMSASRVGSPLLDAQGRVVGLVAVAHTTRNVTIAIPVEVMKQRLAAGGKVTPLSPAIADEPKTAAGALFMKGILAAVEGLQSEDGRKKIDFALTMFQQAVAKQKDLVDAYYLTGRCLNEISRYQDATKAFKQALQIKPDHVEALVGLGSASVNLGWNQDAVEDLKTAIKLRTDYAEAHYYLGLAYGNLGWAPEAIDSFKQTVRISPNYAQAHYNLGVAYMQARKVQEALESFQMAVKTDPGQAQAHLGLGAAYAALGKNAESSEEFKQAIRLRPDYSEAHFGLGIADMNMSLFEDAVNSFKEAIRNRPDDPETHYNLGVAYDKLGKKDEAVASCREAVRLKPDYADAHYMLGAIAIEQQDRGRALDEYKILKDLDKDLAGNLFKLIYP